VQPHPHQPGLIFPSRWNWNVRQKSAIATLCVYSVPATRIQRSSRISFVSLGTGTGSQNFGYITKKEWTQKKNNLKDKIFHKDNYKTKTCLTTKKLMKWENFIKHIVKKRNNFLILSILYWQW
jgi:hypothetical protein